MSHESATAGAHDPSESPEPYDREKRVLLTRSQEKRLNAFIERLDQAAGGLKITGSDLARGLLTLVFDAEPEVLRAARVACARIETHPATADHDGKTALEARLAKLLVEAIRRAPPPKAT